MPPSLASNRTFLYNRGVHKMKNEKENEVERLSGIGFDSILLSVFPANPKGGDV